MIFDSIKQAVQYIKESLQKFTTTGSTLQARLAEIANLIQKAKANNDQAALDKLIVAKSKTLQLQNEYNEFVSKLGPFRSFFISEGQLGIFPVWIIAGAGALASALYVFFEKIKNEGQALELIKKGMLTPSQAQSILGGGVAATIGSAGSLVMWGAIAYGLFMFGPMIAKRFK